MKLSSKSLLGGNSEPVISCGTDASKSLPSICLLHWERTKTEVFNWEGGLPDGTPEGLTLAGKEVDGAFEHGFIMYGVPVGSEKYCHHQLMEVAKGIVSDTQKTAELLSGERRSL